MVRWTFPILFNDYSHVSLMLPQINETIKGPVLLVSKHCDELVNTLYAGAEDNWTRTSFFTAEADLVGLGSSFALTKAVCLSGH